MLPPERPKESPDEKFTLDMSRICPICKSEEDKGFSFDFDVTSDEEKISLICGVGEEIVSHALKACGDEVKPTITY